MIKSRGQTIFIIQLCVGPKDIKTVVFRARNRRRKNRRRKTGSDESRLNRSLVAFNSGKTSLDFDVDVAAGREFLRQIYGGDCR